MLSRCREVNQLVQLGVLKLYLDSEEAASTFIIPKKTFTYFYFQSLGAQQMCDLQHPHTTNHPKPQ